MTTVEPIECTDCHRKVSRSEPLWMFGNPYGPKCGKRYGLVREKRVRAKRPRQQEVEHQPVLVGLDEIDDEENGE